VKTLIIVIVVIVVLAIIAALVMQARRRHRTEALRERFGPEYDRAVSEQGDQRRAEQRLGEVAEQHDRLEIRPLEPRVRERYAADWSRVQASFVDDPLQSVDDADHLVGSVMRDRGYPVDDFDTRAGMVAVDHPDVAEHYRAAHELHRKADEGGATLDDLREAFVHYRALFQELLDLPSGADATQPDETRHVDVRGEDRMREHAVVREERRDHRMSDGPVDDGRVTDGRVADGRVADGRVDDGRLGDDVRGGEHLRRHED